MIQWTEKKIIQLKSNHAEGNSPRQITKGGKLKAYNDILIKLRTSQKKIETL